MDVLAVILLFLTVLIGVVVLAEFADPRRMATVRGIGVMVGGHIVLALAATAVWVAYLLSRSSGLAWAGAALLGVVAGLGLAVWRRSTAAEAGRAAGAGEASGRVAPEAGTAAAASMTAARPVAPGLVIAHGAAAAATVLAAVLVAAGVGR